ncbi:MAG TPA: antibiotic biosynthesis monooxygenase [Candidatus Polarisedimenticolia bacterium]|nr:antibiotic biosynthesis monooxygenase [Candidatus Polarisedimenticolia bacterium]
MIVDLVTFRVKPDKSSEFERHCDDWNRQMKRARGFVTQHMMRRIDKPGEYLATVRWVNRDYRDRFHAAADADLAALRHRGGELLEAPPQSVLYEAS